MENGKPEKKHYPFYNVENGKCIAEMKTSQVKKEAESGILRQRYGKCVLERRTTVGNIVTYVFNDDLSIKPADQCLKK